MPSLPAAISYTDLGWPVLPIRQGSKNPGSLLGTGWHSKATTDIKTVLDWWRTWPKADVAVMLGPSSGLIDVEIDAESSSEREAAERRLAELAGGTLPVTPVWRSRRGSHRLFLWNERLAACPAKIDLEGCIEIRLGGSGKAVSSILPPSDGRKWLVHPDDAPPTALPDPLLAMVLDRRAGQGCGQGSPHGRVPSQIKEGQRNTMLTRLAGALRRIGLELPELQAALIAANEQRCQPPLPRDEVVRIARSIMRYPVGNSCSSNAMWREWRRALRPRR